MDAWKAGDDLTAAGPAWRRWLLLLALIGIGGIYLVLFVHFVRDSKDFVAEQKNDRARAAALDRALSPTGQLHFGTDNAAAALLGTGWHRPEADGTWTSADVAVLYMPVASSIGSGTLVVALDAPVSSRHPRLSLAVISGGRTLAEWHADPARPSVALPVRFDASMVKDGVIELQIKVDRTVSLQRLDIGGDTRWIGVRLRSVRLLP